MSADVDSSSVESGSSSLSLSVMPTHSVLGWPLLTLDGMASFGVLSVSVVDATLIQSSKKTKEKKRNKKGCQ